MPDLRQKHMHAVHIPSRLGELVIKYGGQLATLSRTQEVATWNEGCSEQERQREFAKLSKMAKKNAKAKGGKGGGGGGKGGL